MSFSHTGTQAMKRMYNSSKEFQLHADRRTARDTYSPLDKRYSPIISMIYGLNNMLHFTIRHIKAPIVLALH